MAMRREELLKVAQENPFRMFTGEEIAILCQISHDVVTKVKLAEDTITARFHDLTPAKVFRKQVE